jgi:putative phosphoesterase
VTRVGLISDVHANLDALTAVLDDMPAVDEIVCCGDLVEYYDQPNEVCTLLRERDVRCIRGNHDAYTIGQLSPDEAHRRAFRTDWTRDVLAETHLRWIESLGVELWLEAGERRLWIRHANPWDEERYLFADADALLARLRLEAGTTLVVGHTHRPLRLSVDQGWLVNPGSVGQPRDYDPRAAYAVVDLGTGEVEHRRAAYDVAAMQRRLERMDWDPQIVSILSRTRHDERGAART